MRKIAVVGGGIGGLTFAGAARRAGFEVTVLEREANVVRTGLGGGLGLWPPSQQVLAQIGALAALQTRGRYMPAPAYCDRGGRILAEPSQHFTTRFPILCVARSALLDVLMARCASEGVEIITEADCESLSVCDRTLRVDVRVAGRQDPVTADVVVGADGIHSRVRSMLLAESGRGSPRHCGYAYFRSSIPAATRAPAVSWHTQAFESWSDGIRFGYVPLQEPSVFWFAAVPIGHRGLEPRRGAHPLDEDGRAWLLEALQGWQGPALGTGTDERLDVGELLDLTRAEEILRTDIYKVRGVTRFPWHNAAGNVVLLGDACHATAPNLAQGAGLSIEDAAELVFQLSTAARAADAAGAREGVRRERWRRELQAAIDRYERARKPRARTVQALADAIATVGQLRAPLSTLRDAAMRLAARLLPATTGRVFEAVVARSLGGGRRQVCWEHPEMRRPVVAAVMGDAAFERSLPESAQHFRRLASGGRGTGRVTVEIGHGWLPRLIAAVAGLPPAMDDATFEAAVAPIDRHRERWIRRFGSVAYSTTMSRVRHLGRHGGGRGLVLTEGIGGVLDRLVRFGYRPLDATRSANAEYAVPLRAVAFESTGLWFGDRVRLPLPSWLQPRSAWTETEIDAAPVAARHRSGWRFDGRIELPKLFGGQLLMAYRGEFTPNASCFLDGASSTEASTTQHAVVFGGTGFLGRAVCAELLVCGWHVTVPTRSPALDTRTRFDTSRYAEVRWHPDAESDAAAAALRKAIAGRSSCSRVVIINLAGENPGSSRWSAQTMRSIVTSRLAPIAVVEALLELLRDDIAAARLPPAALPAAMLQASAVGIYGDQGSQLLTDIESPDDAPSSTDAKRALPERDWRAEPDPLERGRAFRIACCRKLEAAAAGLAAGEGEAQQGLAHIANLRIGMVLGHGEGLLPHVQRAAAFGASRLGSGQQYVSWIHVGDAARVIARIAADTMQFADDDAPAFPVNVCAPNPVTCSDFLAAIRAARRTRRGPITFALPPWIPVPAAPLVLATGPSASAVLDSQNAVPARLRARLEPGDLDRLIRFPEVASALTSWECAVAPGA